MSAAVLLRDRFQVRLPETVLIAPALDLSLTNPAIDGVEPTDPWPTSEGDGEGNSIDRPRKVAYSHGMYAPQSTTTPDHLRR